MIKLGGGGHKRCWRHQLSQIWPVLCLRISFRLRSSFLSSLSYLTRCSWQLISCMSSDRIGSGSCGLQIDITLLLTIPIVLYSVPKFKDFGCILFQMLRSSSDSLRAGQSRPLSYGSWSWLLLRHVILSFYIAVMIRANVLVCAIDLLYFVSVGL